jgi:delta(3,5)-delta(2,4)-dienoyl-CoA isomerase
MKTLNLSTPLKHVLQVDIQIGKWNTLNQTFFEELYHVFSDAKHNDEIKCIILGGGTANGFTAGLDLKEFQELSVSKETSNGKEAQRFLKLIRQWQSAITALEECEKPILCAIHGVCIGGGIDLIAATDIRYCSADASFSIKEIDIGIAADLGTLQRLPRIVGNQSFVKELAFTGRFCSAQEALKEGLVSGIYSTRQELMSKMLELAECLVKKSDIALQGTKHLLNRSRDLTIQEGLNYVQVWNACMIPRKSKL